MMEDVEAIVAKLTKAQKEAMVAIDRKWGRVRWATDVWDLKAITVNGVRIQPRTLDALISAGLIWAKGQSVGSLALGDAVRTYLLSQTKE